MRTIMLIVTMIIGSSSNGFAQAKQVDSLPKVFWRNNADKGVILTKPNEMLIVDSKGNKHGKVLSEEKVDYVYMSPDEKKLAYTTPNGIRLAKIETGENYLVIKGSCDYLRWNNDGLGFLFALVEETTKDEIPLVFNFKFFWADGDGKNLKQVYP